MALGSQIRSIVLLRFLVDITISFCRKIDRRHLLRRYICIAKVGIWAPLVKWARNTTRMDLKTGPGGLLK